MSARCQRGRSGIPTVLQNERQRNADPLTESKRRSLPCPERCRGRQRDAGQRPAQSPPRVQFPTGDQGLPAGSVGAVAGTEAKGEDGVNITTAMFWHNVS